MLYFFIFGTIIGSYTSTCIHRYNSNESMIHPNRSKCPQCKHVLSCLDLIPLVSWICLKGKCHYCRQSISHLYPLSEFILGFLYVLLYIHFSLSVELIIYMTLSPVLLWTAFIDFDHLIIPDRTHIYCFLCGLVLLCLDPPQLNQKIIGIFLISTPCFLLAYTTKGIGYGDGKLFASLGFISGWQYILLTFIISSFSASILGLLNPRENHIIPFGPHIMVAFFISLLFGTEIIFWYSEFFFVINA